MNYNDWDSVGEISWTYNVYEPEDDEYETEEEKQELIKDNSTFDIEAFD